MNKPIINLLAVVAELKIFNEKNLFLKRLLDIECTNEPRLSTVVFQPTSCNVSPPPVTTSFPYSQWTPNEQNDTTHLLLPYSSLLRILEKPKSNKSSSSNRQARRRFSVNLRPIESSTSDATVDRSSCGAIRILATAGAVAGTVALTRALRGILPSCLVTEELRCGLRSAFR